MLKGLSFPAKPLVCLQQVKRTWSAAWTAFCQSKCRWFYIDFIWWPFWTPSLSLVSWMNTQRSYLAFQRRHTQTQQQRPESPTVTLTWHASKYKALNSTRGTSSYLFHQLSTELCDLLLLLLLLLLFALHFDVTKMSYVIEGTPRSSQFSYKSRKKYRWINYNHFCNRLFLPLWG